VIEGIVDEKGIPVVSLTIAGQEWQATIDTGFNGDLELPYALGSHVNPQCFGRGLSLLAGGQSVEEEHYLVDFPFDGRTVRALATFVPGDEILIGTHLLSDYRLLIDFPASEVKLERE
jgi:predicted aspartyl protease